MEVGEVSRVKFGASLLEIAQFARGSCLAEGLLARSSEPLPGCRTAWHLDSKGEDP